MPTLLVTNVYVLVLLGVLMLFAWARGSREATLGFLRVMLWSGALGLVIGSLRGRGMDALPIVLGNVLVHVCYAMGWTAMRAFPDDEYSGPECGLEVSYGCLPV